MPQLNLKFTSWTLSSHHPPGRWSWRNWEPPPQWCTSRCRGWRWWFYASCTRAWQPPGSYSPPLGTRTRPCGVFVKDNLKALRHPPGEAVELVLLPVGVEEEAHAAGEVGRSVAGGAGQAGPPGHSTLQHRVGDHCDLEDNQNDDSWEIYSHVVRSSVISPVRLKDRTWLLEVALARTCMAVWRRGTLLSFAETTAAIADSREIVNTLALNIWHEMVRIRLWTISLDINKFTEFWYEQKISHWNWVITL